MTSIPDSEIKATDGKFDSALEHFTMVLNPLSMNTNQLQLETIDEITNTTQITNINFEEFSIFAISTIPQWIKNNTGWWTSDMINDETFLQGIEYLIENDIIIIPPTTQGSGTGSNEIPSWIKNNAGWWVDNTIDDETFVNGIEYLVEYGIIQIN
jgi:hypothetical protein